MEMFMLIYCWCSLVEVEKGYILLINMKYSSFLHVSVSYKNTENY